MDVIRRTGGTAVQLGRRPPESLERTYPLVSETVEALAAIRASQLAAVRVGAMAIIESGFTKSSDEYIWSLKNLPLTSQLACELVRAAPDTLSDMHQAGPQGFIAKADLSIRHLFGLGQARPPSRERLGLTITPSEAVEVGSRTLMLITHVLASGSPGVNAPRTYHAGWQLQTSTHRPVDQRLYFSATVTEERYSNGDVLWQHSVSLFIADPDQLAPEDDGEVYEDERRTRAVPAPRAPRRAHSPGARGEARARAAR